MGALFTSSPHPNFRRGSHKATIFKSLGQGWNGAPPLHGPILATTAVFLGRSGLGPCGFLHFPFPCPKSRHGGLQAATVKTLAQAVSGEREPLLMCILSPAPSKAPAKVAWWVTHGRGAPSPTLFPLHECLDYGRSSSAQNWGRGVEPLTMCLPYQLHLLGS